MSQNKPADDTIYKVIVVEETQIAVTQYSIWPANHDVPLGWKDTGKSGTKEDCLAYLKAVWMDISPQSVLKKTAEMAAEKKSKGTD